MTPVDRRAAGARVRSAVGQGPSAVAVGAGAVWVVEHARRHGLEDRSPARRRDGADPGRPRAPWHRRRRRRRLGERRLGADRPGSTPAKGRVTRIVHVGNRPSAIAVDPNGLYVALRPAGPAHRGGVLRIARRERRVDALDSLDPGLAYDAAHLGAREQHQRRARRVPARRRIVRAASSCRTSRRRCRARARTAGPTASVCAAGSGTRPGSPWWRATSGTGSSADSRSRAHRARSTSPRSSAPLRASSTRAPRATCRRASRHRTRRARSPSGSSAPDTDLLYKLALPSSYAVPRTVPRHEVPGGVPATGPYKVSRVSKDLVELVRNPRFAEWAHAAKPDGYPDRIEIHHGGKPGERDRTSRARNDRRRGECVLLLARGEGAPAHAARQPSAYQPVADDHLSRSSTPRGRRSTTRAPAAR